jgi:energy-coupling factor transporter ATP-binding protein EcfA2
MTTPAVRVVSLQASNVLRLSAVEFTWKDGQRVLTLGGKNGAGKSSVINALAVALGGMQLCPDEPLKRGETRGFVELNLGELVVRREFWRDLLTEQPADGPPAYGETKSRLIVKNTDGVKQEPAQRLLDKLIGKFSFDPTAFAMDDETKQADTLRKIVGLDFKDHDEQRQIAYERRAVYNKEYKQQLVLLDNMPKYDGVPDEELSLSELSAQLTAADVLRQKAVEAQKWFDNQSRGLQQLHDETARHNARIGEVEQEIKALQLKLAALVRGRDEHERIIDATAKSVDQATEALKAANDAVPDTTQINARIHDVEDTNSKIRANVARKNVMGTVVRNQKASEEQDALIAQLDEARAKTIRDTKFPIDGLGISPTGAVTFNGIALKQASTAEQIRVSVAIGFALNPSLKLLCVRNGNALDDDSFTLVAEQAEAAGGQVLMEVVTKNADDVSVFIEDGHS